MPVCKITFSRKKICILTVQMKPCVSDKTVPMPNLNVSFNSLANAVHVTG